MSDILQKAFKALIGTCFAQHQGYNIRTDQAKLPPPPPLSGKCRNSYFDDSYHINLQDIVAENVEIANYFFFRVN